MQQESKNRYPFHIFFLNVIVFTILLIATGFFIYPSMMEFEEKKGTLENLFTQMKGIQQKGIDFQTFSGLRNQIIPDNDYEANVLRSVTEDFYNEKMVNTTKDSYDVFMNKIVEEVNAKKVEKVTEKRETVMDVVLPQYIDVNEPNTEGLSEFKFINYVETILYTFNLSVEGNIGISDVVAIESGKKKSSVESVDASLFYIPLTLKVTGRKEDILDFLYFSENVGSVKVIDGELKVHQDEMLASKAGSGLGKNIYENQFFDVENLRMEEYMDSDSTISSDKDFVTYLKSEQGREKISLELDLRFYIRGLPDYKVRNFVKDLQKRQDGLLKQVNARLKELKTVNVRQSSEMLITSNAINNLSFEIADLGKEIIDLNKMLGKQDTISKTFSNALDISEELDKLEKTLKLEGEKLETYKTNNKK